MRPFRLASALTEQPTACSADRCRASSRRQGWPGDCQEKAPLGQPRLTTHGGREFPGQKQSASFRASCCLVPPLKSREISVSLRQAIREIDKVLKENEGRLIPNSELFHSILNALRDIDQRVIALEQA